MVARSVDNNTPAVKILQRRMFYSNLFTSQEDSVFMKKLAAEWEPKRMNLQCG